MTGLQIFYLSSAGLATLVGLGDVLLGNGGLSLAIDAAWLLLALAAFAHEARREQRMGWRP